MNELENISILRSGLGFQATVDSACDTLGNPVFVLDLDYNLIAYAQKNPSDDFLSNELIERGKFSRETIEFFKKEGLIESVASAKECTLLSGDNIPYDRYFGAINDCDGVMIAFAVIVAFDRPFALSDAESIKRICANMAVQLQNCEFFKNYGKNYQQAVIRSLLKAEIVDHPLNLAYVARIYEGFEDNLFLVILDMSPFSPHDRLPPFFENLFAAAKEKIKYTFLDNKLVLMLSSDKVHPNLQTEFKELFDIISENSLNYAISSRFENLFIMRDYYIETLKSLE